VPLRSYNVNRFNPPGKEKGMQSGHLIAARLGGSNRNPENFVPLYKDANSAMGVYEDQIWGTVREARQTVWYVVTPVFNGNNLIPSGITLYARTTRGVIIPNVYIPNTP
jgi:hypothetical protein